MHMNFLPPWFDEGSPQCQPITNYKLSQLGRNCSREESACTICVDNAANTVLRPCGHGGFCAECVKQLEASGGKCPMCRAKMTSYDTVEQDQ